MADIDDKICTSLETNIKALDLNFQELTQQVVIWTKEKKFP